MLLSFLIVSAVTLVWLLFVDRRLNYQIIRQTGFRAGRIRVYLSAAGIIWMFNVPTGLALYAVGELVPKLGSSGELWLTISLLVAVLVIPLLIMRSAVLAREYKE